MGKSSSTISNASNRVYVFVPEDSLTIKDKNWRKKMKGVFGNYQKYQIK